ncbi:MAG: CsbD family protein [Candidatus Didemnitutus sp.]|nr:CsbD family protein [Candidatus Didemnitutus sp.]
MKSSTQDKVKGTAKTIAGKVKEVTGNVLGNPRLQIAGKMEQFEGQTQKKIGQFKKAKGN